MEIIFAASEVSPFFKVGGLADVAGSLPLALARLGHTVRLVAPFYPVEPPPGASPLPHRVRIAAAGGYEEASLWQLPLEERVTLYLVDYPPHFRSGQVYKLVDEIDLERFCRFSLAVSQLSSLPGWHPDVLHANDWHLGMAVRSVAVAGGLPVVLTIHNVQYQGAFSAQWFLQKVGPLPEADIFGQTGVYPNMLGLGLIHAHAVSTVSPTFAREMVTPEFAYGLHPLFARRQQAVEGILNGLDYDEFNPATDPLLPSRFNGSSLGQRLGNKTALQGRAGLPPDPDVPLLGMVTRLADQKGLDILVPALQQFLPTSPAQFVILGTGDAHYHHEVSRMAETYKGRLAAFLTFDEGLARLIYGGCDVFVMPSRFEPCGLGQLISMRYGAIPLVRHTGGLADTVTDLDPDLARGTGLVFTDYTTEALVATLRRAVAAFARREEWRRLQHRVMGLDFSWGASARRYEALYQRLVATVKG